MKLIYFIRILQRHILLLILVPLLLAAVVFFLTRKDQWNYISETTIYTGITSGYSIQQQGTTDIMVKMIIFDNIINLIRARQTLEEVSVSLLAQHLLLSNYDPRYILKEHYEELMAKVPPDILDIVRKVKRERSRYYRPPSSQNVDDYSKASDEYSRSVWTGEMIETPSGDEMAVNDKYYVVKRGETMYSIARSNGMTIEELKEKNGLASNALNEGQRLLLGQKPERLNPRKTTQDMDVPEPSPIAEERIADTVDMSSFYRLTDTVPVTRAYSDSTIFDRLVRRLLAYGHQNDYNFIYKLWNSKDDRFYSIAVLSTVTVGRVQNSDLIKLTYKSPDPGICQYTLVFLTKIFIRNYKILKQNQTDAVIAYFKRQLEDAMRRLQKAENDLLVFNERNNIINYYEQTKEIAITKEELDVTFQNKQIALASSDAAIKIIEKKLEAHAKLSLNTSAILRLRGELADATMQIANIEIDMGNDSATIQQLAMLKDRVESIKRQIKDNIDRLYMVTNSVEGLPIKDLLNAWLANVVAYEESKAALRVLNERRLHFQRIYEIFAPLGAEMKRIERLIGVTESEFLQLLHDLNLAKLRQQDDELSTNLKVVDPPYYPLNPIRTRALMLVLVAGLLGFVLILAILFAMEFFDTTIKTPDRIEKYLKLKVAGIYPKIIKQLYSVDIGFILPRLVELLAQNIKMALLSGPNPPTHRPLTVLLISTRDAEGKTTIGREVCRKLKSFGENALFINYFKEHADATGHVSTSELVPPVDDEIQYPIRESFFDTRDIAGLLEGHEYLDTSNYDYLFVELPSLINNAYPLDLVTNFDFALLVLRANRSWTDADATILKAFQEVFHQKIQVALNGVELLYLDSILGEVPKPRSKFRRTMKRILLFQFREKSLI
jgi:uncharacterized protein involved in exopolysaccharide biosynthesis/LysM repeat protein